MNKKFYFGLVATAALFASCSSDDLSVNEARQDIINDGDRAAIQLLVGNPGSTTRGTGTVGGMAENDPNNKWGGQTFNVSMFKKNTLDYALSDPNDATSFIYKNTEFTAPNEIAGVSSSIPAMEVTDTSEGGLVVESKVSYFPQEGNFDFWAYRTDGAEGTNEPAVSGTSMVLDFTIDGTQDIMTAKAVPNVTENTGADEGTYGPNKVPESRIFSAYSVRREVKPLLNFQHQLARIAFKVKGSKDLCDKSADPTDNTATVANELAVKVTAIKLKSLATGKLHVAYTAEPENGIIEWTDGSEAVLPLKQRGVRYTTPATIEWFSCNTSYKTFTATANPAKTVVFAASSTVYTSKAVDNNTGLPLAANAVIASAATDLASCWIPIIVTDPSGAQTSVNANLVDLEPVAPIWNTSAGTEGAAYATPVGEALLVAPQLNYELTVETSQKVPETTETYYCTVEQALGANASTHGAATAITVEAVADDAALEASAKAKAATGKVYYLVGGTTYKMVNVTTAATAAPTDAVYDAPVTITVEEVADAAAQTASADAKTATGDYYYKIAAAYSVINVSAAASGADATYYFKDPADASAAATAYATWKADQSDATKTATKDAALAKGSTTNGGAVTTVKTFTVKNDTKTILLNGPSQTVGEQTTYKPYKANKSYTITLTLAGMEPITGQTDNINIGGYTVDTEGSEFDIDMDEATPLP